jgi:hypothetical protein
MAFAKKEKKIPVETLQEEHLTGPASESIEEIREALQDNKVVVFNEVPQHEKVVFRNQRDPGHALEFHYSSKTHPFKQYTLVDGQEYPLPREVIKNLESCRENIEKYRKNTHTGLPEIYIAGYKTHFVCERVA